MRVKIHIYIPLRDNSRGTLYFKNPEESCKAKITSGEDITYLKDILNAIKRIGLVNHVETFEGAEKTPPGAGCIKT